MTTLDQIRLLEEKVESAVAKMQQLQAENDALRNKCAELTNALDSKTEQLLAFTSNKEEIEEGIRNALDRLNFIENSVMSSDNGLSNGQASLQITPGVRATSVEEIQSEPEPEMTVPEETDETLISDFDTPVTEEPVIPSNPQTTQNILNSGFESNSLETQEHYENVENNVNNVENVNFDSMKMTEHQPNLVPESAEPIKPNNDVDEGDQDAFEYDIF